MNKLTTLSIALTLAMFSSGVMSADVIMPVGDSITKGSGGQLSYRKKLFQDLKAEGCTLDMYGSEKSPVVSGVWHASNGDDTYHAGFSGRKANKVLSEIGQQITDGSLNGGKLPNYVLLHVGTNDILAGDAVGTYYAGISDGSTIGEINRIVDELLPHAKVLVANIIPLADNPSTPYNERTMAVELGNQVGALVADRRANDYIYLVDVRSGFNNSTMTIDGIHPNNSGEALIADRFKAALKARGICGGNGSGGGSTGGGSTALTCNGLPVTVNLALGQNPTNGNDVILGTSGDDSIIASGGNDTICALGGNDSISAGSGDDWIDAGPGKDTVLGGSGNDTIYGADDDDLLKGGDGNDVIDGGNGNDSIRGQTGNDTLRGGAGNDTLVGGSENDSLSGGAGIDSCQGNAGVDSADSSCETVSSVP